MLACLAAGLLASVLVLLLTPPTYTSSTQLHVAITPAGSEGRDIYGSLPYLEQRANTYAGLVENQSFQDAVAAATGPEATPEVTAVVEAETSLLTLTAAAGTPADAQRAATAAAERLITEGTQLEAAGPGGPPLQVTVAEPAELPTEPDSPVALLYLAVGLIVGAALGLGVARLAAQNDDRLRGPDDLGPVAERVGPIFWLPTRRWGGATSGPRREDYVHRLAALHHELTTLPGSRGRVLVLTAPTPQHSATTAQVAEDLTATLGEGGRSTLLALVEPQPGAEAERGLSDVLAGSSTLSSILRTDSARRIVVGPGTQPLRLLTASVPDMQALTSQLCNLADVVVFAAPDLAAPAGTALLARSADAVLVVAARGDARGEELLDARATIERWGARYLGVLLAPRAGRAMRLPQRPSLPVSTSARPALDEPPVTTAVRTVER